MRKLLLVLLSASAAACGSSSSGGGGGGPLSGTVGGRAFSPADVEAITAGTGSTPCPLPLGTSTVNLGIKALAIEVTSYGGACNDFACKLHTNAQTVTVLIARLNPSGVEPALNPGTYTVSSSPQTVSAPDINGVLTDAYAQAVATNATCMGTPSGSIAGGTVRLDSVTGPVTGHVSLTFQDGSTLQGDFSAPMCTSPTVDVCALATAALAGSPQLCQGTPSCGP